MGTLANILSIDVVGHRSDESSLLSLMEVLCGSPVARDSDENPFLKRPEDLSENAWHLVRSDQTGDLEAALWKPKGEARQIILDLPIICWEITREFHETNDHRTDWMMREYKIITVANVMPQHKNMFDHNLDGFSSPNSFCWTLQESFSICRIWQDPASHVQVGSSMPFDNNQQRQSADDSPVKNSTDLDIFTRGDYLELLDLEVPLYPCPNSENPS